MSRRNMEQMISEKLARQQAEQSGDEQPDMIPNSPARMICISGIAVSAMGLVFSLLNIALNPGRGSMILLLIFVAALAANMAIYYRKGRRARRLLAIYEPDNNVENKG